MLRSRIVLLAGEGLQNKQIATALDVAPRMAALWRGRFIEYGIEGLLKDAPRPGRSESISRASLIEKTTQSTPAQCDALVHACHGAGDGHLESFGVAHLAGQRSEATSRGKLQGQQRSELRR
jgi:hypothetical protein